MKTNTKRLLCCFLSFLLLISAVPLTTVTANAETSVSYLDENGTTRQCTEYKVITNQTTLSAGWYVVNRDVKISERITVNGDVHLILSDGKTLNAESGINVAKDNSFTVYAQSAGDTAGKLTANGSDYNAGIGGNENESGGTVTINGGNVTAKGGFGGAGIGGGYGGAGGMVTINGGTVKATGGDYGAGIGGGDTGAGGTVTVTGGTVTATGGNDAAGIGGGYQGADATVTINGGTVKATGGSSGAGIGGGYYNSNTGGTVTVNGGTVTATGGQYAAGIGGGERGNGGTVTINGGTVTANGGKHGAGIGGGDAGAGGTVTIRGGTVEATAGANCQNAIGAGYNSTSNGKLTVLPKDGVIIYVTAGNAEGSAASVGGSPFTTGTEIIGIVAGNKYVKTVEKKFVKYLDENGTEQQCKEYTELTDQTTLSAGWYVVNSDVTISSRITVSGDVHLILADGKTLNAESGINVAEGNSFTVYAQSAGDTAGKLTANGPQFNAGIGGNDNQSCGTVTINGGTVTATGGGYAAGIGGGQHSTGGTVTINGGTVNATGGDDGAGIGGGFVGAGGTVIIYGGTVKATGGNFGAGIGGGDAGAGGTVIIYGGTVTAGGGYLSAGIGGGYAGAGGTVTINGGTVEATAGTDCKNAIGAGYGSTNNGTLTVSPKNGVIYVTAGDAEDSAESIDGSPFMTETEIINSVAGKKYVKTVEKTFVKYIDADGAEQQCTEYTVITDQTTLSDGWYVVNSDVTISSRITVSGNVHLILANGKTLTASKGINVSDNNAFTIYAQSTGDAMGKLTANGSDYNAGIGGNEYKSGGTVTVNGGTVTATGGKYAAGIGGGNYGPGGTVTIRGGTVTATGGNYGAGIGGAIYGAGGKVTINGGTVTAAGGNNGAGIGGGKFGAGATVTISGGSVEATAGDYCNNAIGAGYSDSPISNGTLTFSPKAADSAIYVTAGDAKDSASNVSGSPFIKDKDIIDSVVGKKYVKTTVGQVPVQYLDENGKEQQCTEYTVITNQTELSTGWYVVNRDVTISSRITVSGDVRLILADGKTLTASKGINVAAGNSFTVYAQSPGDTAGKLTVNGSDYNAGIGGKDSESGGTVTINGGTVDATGGKYAAGIGGADGIVAINGGTVDAKGGDGGAGIGGGYYNTAGTVTVNGGTVTAKGGAGGAGIGGGSVGNGGTVTINGGTVEATGGNGGAGIGGGGVGNGGTVTINGGTVTATGGTKGAGIGGGNTGAGATVTINGGTVEATAGTNCKNAIGAGYSKRPISNGTLTVSPINNSAIYVKAGNAKDSAKSIEDSPFMTGQDIIDSVAGKKYVKTCSASIPTYTVTIPETVELGDSAQISAENVSLPDGFSLCVKLTDASDFKVRTDKGAELSYTIAKGGAQITVDAIVLSVPGGSDTGAATLVFSKPENTVYAGKYKGSLTFSIKIE